MRPRRLNIPVALRSVRPISPRTSSTGTVWPDHRRGKTAGWNEIEQTAQMGESGECSGIADRARERDYAYSPGSGAALFVISIQLVVQRLQADPQLGGGARLMAIMFLQHAH